MLKQKTKPTVIIKALREEIVKMSYRIAYLENELEAYEYKATQFNS